MGLKGVLPVFSFELPSHQRATHQIGYSRVDFFRKTRDEPLDLFPNGIYEMFCWDLIWTSIGTPPVPEHHHFLRLGAFFQLRFH